MELHRPALQGRHSHTDTLSTVAVAACGDIDRESGKDPRRHMALGAS